MRTILRFSCPEEAAWDKEVSSKSPSRDPLIGRKLESLRPPSTAVFRAPGEPCDIVQFTTAIFYVEEAEGQVKLDVMRLGSMEGPCSVHFRTEDGSATCPEKYHAQSGELKFEHGEDQKTISVPIVDSPDWAATVEFKVVLEDPTDCDIGVYLHTCRVKIIDNNEFPSSKYQEKLRLGEEGVDQISGSGLLVEFLRLMWNLKGNRWRTTLILCLDHLQNLYLVFTLYVSAYLVNVVFADSESSEERLFWQRGETGRENRLMTATIIGVFVIVPLLFLHWWAYIRLRLDLRGRSRIWLQTSLFRKYLNYTDEARTQVSPADMQSALMVSADQLAEGYGAVIEISERFGKLAVMMYFVVTENPTVAWSVFAMPLIMMMWTVYRNAWLEGPEDSIPKRREVVNMVADTCARYPLIANYFQRPQINDIFSQKVTALRRIELPEEIFAMMSSFFFTWIGPVFMGTYIAMHSHGVLDKDLELGTFLATLTVFKDIARDFAEGYENVMRVAEMVDPLRHYCVLLNAETDLLSWKAANRSRHLATLEARRSVHKMLSSEDGSKAGPMTSVASAISSADADGGGGIECSTDLIPISLKSLTFGYTPKINVLDELNLKVKQGKMVSVGGRHGVGKSTLLRLLGFELFPTSGEYFVPTHLRVLHLSREAYLLQGSAWHNITFGCSQPRDIDPDRVKRVLERLGIWDLLQPYVISDLDKHREVLARATSAVSSDHGQADEISGDGWCGCSYSTPNDPGMLEISSVWQRGLNYSTRFKIHLARAFMMNPEVLVMNRPLHHFNADEQAKILELLREHVSNRGFVLPTDRVAHRRPRTLFYTAESMEHVMAADVALTVTGTTLHEFNVEDASESEKEMFLASYAQLVGQPFSA